MLLILYVAVLIITSNSKCTQYEYSNNNGSSSVNNQEYSVPSIEKTVNLIDGEIKSTTAAVNQSTTLHYEAEFQEANLLGTTKMFSADKLANKNLPVNFLDYFNLSNIIQPLADRISATLTYHPNNGLSNYLNPQYLWQQISDKGQQLLSNPNIAIFGIGQTGAHDYPFPYRIYKSHPIPSHNETTP